MADRGELEVFHRVCVTLTEEGPDKYPKVALELGRTAALLACGIWLKKENSLQRLGYYEKPDKDIKLDWLANLDFKAAEEVVLKGREIIQSDAMDYFNTPKPKNLNNMWPALIALPLRVQRKVRGALNLWLAAGGSDRTVTLPLARELAGQLSADFIRELAPKNTHVQYVTDRGFHDMLEAVPVTPSVKGLSVAARIVRKSPGCGCFFDFFPQEMSLSLGFGEVMGGSRITPALNLAVRLVMKTLAGENLSPGLLLTRLNSIVQPELERVGFICNALYSIIDMGKNTLSYANAGHHPPLLVRETGQVEKLQATGPFLGLEPNSAFGFSEVPFRPGDILVFYCRSMIETLNDDRQTYTADRLGEVVRKYIFYGASSLLDYIILDYNQFLGSRPMRENFALVVVKREKGY